MGKGALWEGWHVCERAPSHASAPLCLRPQGGWFRGKGLRLFLPLLPSQCQPSDVPFWQQNSQKRAQHAGHSRAIHPSSVACVRVSSIPLAPLGPVHGHIGDGEGGSAGSPSSVSSPLQLKQNRPDAVSMATLSPPAVMLEKRVFSLISWKSAGTGVLFRRKWGPFGRGALPEPAHCCLASKVYRLTTAALLTGLLQRAAVSDGWGGEVSSYLHFSDGQRELAWGTRLTGRQVRPGPSTWHLRPGLDLHGHCPRLISWPYYTLHADPAGGLLQPPRDPEAGEKPGPHPRDTPGPPVGTKALPGPHRTSGGWDTHPHSRPSHVSTQTPLVPRSETSPG